eukprot:gene12046-biopygen16205
MMVLHTEVIPEKVPSWYAFRGFKEKYSWGETMATQVDRTIRNSHSFPTILKRMPSRAFCQGQHFFTHLSRLQKTT